MTAPTNAARRSELDQVLSDIHRMSHGAPQLWTQDEAIQYECVCEVIPHVMSFYSAWIFQEEQKPNPDTALIADWHAECTRLWQERRALKPKDSAKVAQLNQAYGALVRKWNRGEADAAAS